ncbi:unnamed protein product, partial [marine sediment metagenome]
MDISKKKLCLLKGIKKGEPDTQIEVEIDQSIKKAITLENIANMPSIG